MTPEIYKTNNGRLKLEPESIEGIMQVTGVLEGNSTSILM